MLSILSMGPAAIRLRAPTLSMMADRIGRRAFLAFPVSDRDGLEEYRPMAITEWLALVQLLTGLLTVFASQCGNGQTPEAAAAWLRDSRPWTFKRFRLRRAIAQQWGGSLVIRGNLTRAIEDECDMVTPPTVSMTLLEAALLV